MVEPIGTFEHVRLHDGTLTPRQQIKVDHAAHVLGLNGSELARQMGREGEQDRLFANVYELLAPRSMTDGFNSFYTAGGQRVEIEQSDKIKYPAVHSLLMAHNVGEYLFFGPNGELQRQDGSHSIMRRDFPVNPDNRDLFDVEDVHKPPEVPDGALFVPMGASFKLIVSPKVQSSYIREQSDLYQQPGALPDVVSGTPSLEELNPFLEKWFIHGDSEIAEALGVSEWGKKLISYSRKLGLDDNTGLVMSIANNMESALNNRILHVLETHDGNSFNQLNEKQKRDLFPTFEELFSGALDKYFDVPEGFVSSPVQSQRRGSSLLAGSASLRIQKVSDEALSNIDLQSSVYTYTDRNGRVHTLAFRQIGTNKPEVIDQVFFSPTAQARGVDMIVYSDEDTYIPGRESSPEFKQIDGSLGKLYEEIANNLGEETNAEKQRELQQRKGLLDMVINELRLEEISRLMKRGRDVNFNDPWLLAKVKAISIRDTASRIEEWVNSVRGNATLEDQWAIGVTDSFIEELRRMTT